MTDRTKFDGDSPAHRIIAAFGGIRPMAAKLGVAVTTVQGWKERGTIPAARRAEIESAAKRHEIDLAGADLDGMSEPQPAIVEGKADASVPPRASAAAPSATTETKSPPRPLKTPGARRRSPLIWAVMALVVVAAGAIAVGEWLTRSPDPVETGAPSLDSSDSMPANETAEAPPVAAPTPVPAPVDDRFTALIARLEALESRSAPGESLEALDARVAGLEERVVPGDSNEAVGARLEELAATVATLESAVAALDRRLSSLPNEAGGPALDLAPLKAAMTRLETRLDALDAAMSAPRDAPVESAIPDDTLAVLALRRIGRALDRGTPFAAEVAVLSSRLGDSGPQEALQILGAHGDVGVATLDELIERLPFAAPPADEDAAVSESLWDAALAQLVDLVSVKRVDIEADTTDAGSLLAFARSALSRGDVVEALALARRVAPDTVPDLDGWISAAAVRVSCVAALDQIEGAVLAASSIGAAAGE